MGGTEQSDDVDAARSTRDAELLERLAGSSDPVVLQAVVENPATPGAALRRLALSAPGLGAQVVARLTDPADLDALVREGLDGVEDARGRWRLEQLLTVVASSPHLGDGLARALAGIDTRGWPLLFPVLTLSDAKEALLVNPAVSREVVLAVATEDSPGIGKALVRALASGALAHLDEDTRQELTDHVLTGPTLAARGEAYRRLPLPADVLQRAVAAREWQVRKGLARRKNCPPHLLVMLLHDSAPSVAEAAAKNPALPESALTAGLLSNRRSLHPHLLGNLRRLTWAERHPDPRVRRVAARLEERVDVIARLAEDDDDQVRASASARLLELLAAQ